MKAFGVIALILLLPLVSLAKKVEGKVVTQSGDTLAVSISGYSNGLFKPFPKIKSESDKIKVEEVKSIYFGSEVFQVRRVVLFEDTTYIIAKPVEDNIYLGIARYRPCTCNNSFRTVKCYLYGADKVILKRVLGKKVLLKNSHQLEVPEELLLKLKKNNYLFSSVPQSLLELNI